MALDAPFAGESLWTTTASIRARAGRGACDRAERALTSKRERSTLAHMDDDARAAFRFAEAERLEDGVRWTARFAEWDPYRHMTLTMAVTLVHADGRVESFEHGMGAPEGIGARDREQVRAALAFECRCRAGIFARARTAREAAEREAARSTEDPAPAPENSLAPR